MNDRYSYDNSEIWGDDGIPNMSRAEAAEIPVLLSAANVLLQCRLYVAVKKDRPKSADAARKAWSYNKAQAVQALQTLPSEQQLFSTKSTPPDLRKLINKRLPGAICLGLLTDLWVSNPFAPYDVKVSEQARTAAAAEFAADLGCPPSWAATAKEEVLAALKLHGHTDKRIWSIVIAVAGIAVTVLALPLATALAPAGLAGGAAVLSGLAALGGSTGLVGGLSVMISVGAVGAATATVGASLAIGSVEQVEERVIILQAQALAKRKLRPGTTKVSEWPVLQEMAHELIQQAERFLDVEGKKTNHKDAKKKLAAVEKAMQKLKEAGVNAQ